MIKQRIIQYSISFILMILIIIIISSTLISYHVRPSELYYVDNKNLIEDNSFEINDYIVGDCCEGNVGNANISASKSVDAYDNEFSLNLTSSNHCACINKEINNILPLEKYLISFYYKGDNPKFCDWVNGDNQCILTKTFNSTHQWSNYKNIIVLTEKSESAFIYFYANSNGKYSVTDLYDNIIVNKLTKMDVDYNYHDKERYIVKTEKSNIVHNGELLNEDGYYIVKGEPDITVKFPIIELIILVIMTIILLRILFIGVEKKIISEGNKINKKYPRNDGKR